MRKIETKPQNINARNWFYENKASFTFVHEVVDKDGKYIQTDQFEVPKKSLAKFINPLSTLKKD